MSDTKKSANLEVDQSNVEKWVTITLPAQPLGYTVCVENNPKESPITLLLATAATEDAISAKVCKRMGLQIEPWQGTVRFNCFVELEAVGVVRGVKWHV